MHPVIDQKLMDDLRPKFKALLDKNPEHGYSSSVNHFLRKENVLGNSFDRDIILPLPKEEWPSNFTGLLTHRYDPQFRVWPQTSMYNYTMDIFCPPHIPSALLYLGYAMVDGQLIQCPFYVVFKMINHPQNGEDLIYPEDFVIDPLAVLNDKKPDCYAGVNIPENFVQDWFLTRGKNGNPLENYVKNHYKKEHEERIYDSYMKAYWTQMTHEPGWFPPELIAFAKKENLPIPKQERRDY